MFSFASRSFKQVFRGQGYTVSARPQSWIMRNVVQLGCGSVDQLDSVNDRLGAGACVDECTVKSSEGVLGALHQFGDSVVCRNQDSAAYDHGNLLIRLNY